MAANQSSLLDEDREASDWIELHNPGPAAINLEGWFLTDDPLLLTKWRFPVFPLAAGSNRVVFASAKDRRGPAAWHTNFRLAAEGGYLALVQPDGRTIASEFAPSYPAQRNDISYGLPTGRSTRNLLAGAPVSTLVPLAASDLSADWNQPGYQPSASWKVQAGFGIGYDPTPDGGGATNNLALKGVAKQSTTGFGFGPELAIDGNPSSFTHTEGADNASTWSVDLRRVFELRRVVIRNRDSCCGSRLRDITVSLLGADGKTVAWSSGLLNRENILNSPAILTLDFQELNLGAISARFIQVARTPDPDLSGSGGVGNADEDSVLSLGEVEAYGVDSISYASLIRTDLTAAMQGRNASVFVRVPFVLESTDGLQALKLNLRRDDGVVVYLNGRPVAALNAPASPVWNSPALLKRAKNQAFEADVMDLLPLVGQLRTGTNWLAFQGLNAGAGDVDFLLDATLTAESGPGSLAAYLERPTPGAPNNVGWNLGRVEDTRFNVERGFYSQPFDLIITTATVGAQIRYTLDGSKPTATTGLVYNGPLRISRTSVVRAAAFKPDFLPTDVDTHSYLFVDSIVSQPAQPAGFPTSWAGITADYAMDPRITQNQAYSGSMSNSLRSIPTISIATANDDLFGATRGIYANPERNGIDWERPVSIEWLGAGADAEFQADCGLRIQGGYFRARGVTRKHSLRLLFKDEYGPGRLREDLFREFGAAREFDTLVLRAGANDGYAWDAARDTEQFTRDQFGRELALRMGLVAPHGRFVHVYLNGLYWGLYNLVERPAEDFSATYFGGEPADWDAVNAGDVKNGSLDGWNAFLNLVRATATPADYFKLKGQSADGRPNPAFTNYFDATNYQDYMLLNIWGGNWDWPNKNFWFGRDRTGRSGGFKFYMWDFENTMGNNRDRSPLNMVSPRAGVTGSWVGEPHDRLKRNTEYRIEFADRVQRHFFNGGPLSPEALVTHYSNLVSRVELAVISETARWGDDHFSPPQDLTDWRRERDWLLGTYLPQRTAVVLGQFRAAGLYPQTAAPVFAPHGGVVAAGSKIQISVNAPELYYTTNGLDPRLPGGAVRPEAIRVLFNTSVTPANPNLVQTGQSWRYLDTGVNPGNAWTSESYDDSTWKSGPSPLGYGDNDEATVVGFVDANPATAGVQKNATTYFRTAFTVDSPAAFERIRLSLTYDDGAAVFLNGQEVMRTANLPADARFDTFSNGQVSDNTIESREDLKGSLLKPGRNVLAVEVHQSDAGSSDISFDLELVGIAAASGGGGANSSFPVLPAAPTLLKARARQGAEWSALAEALFTPDTLPATSNQLVIAEFCYRPFDPTNSTELAISRDRDDFEFIELMNISPQSADLSGVRFTAGVLFSFSQGTLLKPGERAILVSNRAAFESRHGTGWRVLGEYQGRLDNSGEEIRLIDAAGADIRRFTFDDNEPWPSGANRNGYSLVLIHPSANPDHSNPGNWRTSLARGGNPGGSDSLRFSGSNGADLNGNGQADFMDYSLGLSGLTNNLSTFTVGIEMVEIAGSKQPHLNVIHTRSLAADDAQVGIEIAAAATGPWLSATEKFTLVREERIAEGVVRLTLRHRDPLNLQQPAAFLRLTARQRP